MTEENKIKVTIAPGAFDSFEGTQEELDELQKEIMDLFANKTRDEIEAMSRPINVDELLEDNTISDEQFEQLLQALVGNPERKLQ